MHHDYDEDHDVALNEPRSQGCAMMMPIRASILARTFQRIMNLVAVTASLSRSNFNKSRLDDAWIENESDRDLFDYV